MNSHIPAPYPLDALHNMARDAAIEVKQQVKAPDAMIAMSVIMTMAICSQGIAVVKLPDGRVRPLSLNMLTIAESGDGKTVVDDLVCKSIRDYDQRQIEAYKSAVLNYSADVHVWEVERKSFQAAMKKKGRDTECVRAELHEHVKNKPVEPRVRRVVYQEVSDRALRDALQGDGEAIALMSDEGEVILKSDLMGKWGLLNAIWGGAASLPLDRADMDFVDVRNPRVTIGIMVQPEVFKDFQSKRGELGRSSGHWARYLVGQPASTKGTRFMGADEYDWVHLPKFHARVADLLAEYAKRRATGFAKPDLLTFSPEAREVWINAHNTVEGKMSPWGELREISDFASKSTDIVGRLAAIFHLFSGQEGAISVDTLQRAMRVVEWHCFEYQRLFVGDDAIPQEQKDVEGIARYLCRRYWRNGMTFAERNEVYKCGPVRNRGRYGMALDALVAQGAAWIGQTKTGRRFIHLNPDYFNRLAWA